jgi:hypothetical protein
MPITIALLGEREEQSRHGSIKFNTLLVRSPGDYTCEPQSLLSREQVEDLSWQLRHLPRRVAGRIGPYRWREQDGQ